MDGNIGYRNYRRNYLVTLHINEMKTDGTIYIIVLCIVFIGGYISASLNTKRNMRKEAIAAGVAQWEVNATNGVTTFVYIKK